MLPDDWRIIGDILDIIGIFKPLTVALQSLDCVGIVYLLPKLLNLLTTKLKRPAKGAHQFSGRSIDVIKKQMNKVGTKENPTDVKELISDLQHEMIGIILHGYFGEASKEPKLAKGRLNQFSVLFAWGVCSGMDPCLLVNWDERITKPLEVLLKEGYAQTAYKETADVYASEIMGIGIEGDKEGEGDGTSG